MIELVSSMLQGKKKKSGKKTEISYWGLEEEERQWWFLACMNMWIVGKPV